MTKSTLGLLLLAALAAGCGRGPKGSAGEEGPAGPQGPDGPGSPAPLISNVAPQAITSGTKFRIRGSGFGATAADNTVYVNGIAATVLSASPTEIWAQGAPMPAMTGDAEADVTVFTGGHVSNAARVSLLETNGYVEVPTVPIFNPGVAPSLLLPGWVALDPEGENLWIGDVYFGIFKMSLADGTVEPYVYSYLADYIPAAMRFGPDGKLYYSSYNAFNSRSRIERVEGYGQTTIISQIAFQLSRHLTFAPNGDMFVSDLTNRIGRVKASDNTLEFIANTGSTTVGLEWADGALHAVLEDGSVIRYDVTQDPVTSQFVTSVSGAKAATTDGVNLILLVSSPTASIVRVSPSGDEAILQGPVPVTQYNNIIDASLVRTKTGEYYFATYSTFQVYRMDAQGVTEPVAGYPYIGADSGIEIGGTYFVNPSFACSFGMGGLVYAIDPSGESRKLASDVCTTGDSIERHNGMLVVADQRGWISSLDPSTGAATVLSTDPNIAAPRALAVDANGDLFVGVEDGATGDGKIVKITADGMTVNPSFVTGLADVAESLTVSGTDLYITQSDRVLKVPTAGGSPTTVLPASFGLQSIYGSGLSWNDEVVVVDGDFGAFSIAANGAVTQIGDYYGSHAFIDSYNRLIFADGGFYGVSP